MTSLRLACGALLLAVACTSVTIVPRQRILLPMEVDRADARAAIVLELAKSPFPPSLPPGARITEESLVALVGEHPIPEGQKVSGWYPESLEQDVVNAGFKHGRNHYLRAAIFIEADAVQTRIVQSEGLNQQGDRIHRAADMWLGQLEEQIRTALSRMAALRASSRVP